MNERKIPLFMLRFERAAKAVRNAPNWNPFLQYAHAFGLSVLLFLFLYTMHVEALVPSNHVPPTYKSLLLKEVPGPRLIIDAGSNGHYSLDAEKMSAELGLAVINIADSSDYDLESKINRIRTNIRPNDTVLLPLEWSYYIRDTLTGNFLNALFGEASTYYRNQPVTERVGLAVSIPPAWIYREWKDGNNGFAASLVDGMDLPQRMYLETLQYPHGSRTREKPGTVKRNMIGRSCDQAVFGKHFDREKLEISNKFRRSLNSLKSLKRNGVRVIFTWPTLAGDGCMTSHPGFASFREQVQALVKNAGFEFVGTVMEAVYPTYLRDDNPYHLIAQGSELHTEKMIGFLKAAGVTGNGNPLDVGQYLRRKIFEYEIADMKVPQVRQLEMESEVNLSDRASGSTVAFGAGWWAQDPFGRLMRDNRAAIGVWIPDDVPANAYLSLGGLGVGKDTYVMTASVDSNYVHHGRFDEAQELNIPVRDLPRGGPFWLHLDLPEAGPASSPSEQGKSPDERTVTVRLSTVKLTTSPVVAPMPSISDPQLQGEPARMPQLASSGDAEGLIERMLLGARTGNNSGVRAEVGNTGEDRELKLAQNWQYLPKEGLVLLDQNVNPAVTGTTGKKVEKRDANLASQLTVGGIQAFPVNNPVAMGSGVADNYLKFDANWWNREPGGRWMRNRTARLSFVLPPDLPDRSVIRLFGDVFQGSHQSFQVLYGDRVLVHTMLGLGSAVDIPVDNLPAGVPVDLTLWLPNVSVVSPAKLGLGQDERELTGFVAALELRTHFAN